MKRVVCVIAFMFLAVTVIGCASTSSSRFGTSSVSGIEGKTEEAIIAQFGNPFKKYTTSDGIKVMEYRQSAEEGGAFNTIMAIASYGMLSGQNSAYVDIMKIYFKEGRATKATFEEKVQGMFNPGM